MAFEYKKTIAVSYLDMENYIQIKKKYLFFREDAKNLTKSILKEIKKNYV